MINGVKEKKEGHCIVIKLICFLFCCRSTYYSVLEGCIARAWTKDIRKRWDGIQSEYFTELFFLLYMYDNRLDYILKNEKKSIRCEDIYQKKKREKGRGMISKKMCIQTKRIMFKKGKTYHKNPI